MATRVHSLRVRLELGITLAPWRVQPVTWDDAFSEPLVAAFASRPPATEWNSSWSVAY